MVKTKEHVAEMRLLGDAELLERLSETRRELFNLRFHWRPVSSITRRASDRCAATLPASPPSCASVRLRLLKPPKKVSSHD